VIRKKTFHSYFIPLLFLLALPALACGPLSGSSEEGESAAEVAASIQEALGSEGESSPDSSEVKSGEAEEVSQDSENKDVPKNDQEAVSGALRSGLEVNAMRLLVTTEDLASGQITDLTLAFVRPDRYQLITEGMEIIVIDDTTYLRDANGDWSTIPGTEMTSTVEDSLTAYAGEEIVEDRLDTLSGGNVNFEGTETINGINTKVYSFDEGLEEAGFSGHVKMWIGEEDGLLYRQEVLSQIGEIGSHTTMNFEYGPDVKIEPPEL
jgi:outer membrane lipoprotein-sorting protein